MSSNNARLFYFLPCSRWFAYNLTANTDFARGAGYRSNVSKYYTHKFVHCTSSWNAQRELSSTPSRCPENHTWNFWNPNLFRFFAPPVITETVRTRVLCLCTEVSCCTIEKRWLPPTLYCAAVAVSDTTCECRASSKVYYMFRKIYIQTKNRNKSKWKIGIHT